MTDTVDHSELDKLHSALGQLTGPLLTKFKRQATYYVAEAIKGVIQKYPQGKNSPVEWPSAKARRWYFWARRKAGLSPEYVRGSDKWSQRLQQNWTIQRGDTWANLGNRATYASYVASSQYQTKQHKATGFTTDEQAAAKVEKDGTMRRIVNAHVEAIVKEAFRGL